ncbi:hypothetical protein ACVRXQ_03425 [Streptococcus panodentis]|uniref:Lipoprotein n=1 Tax=Streptococcus panodentis TaxID=1581472 RepID=A0ABS5AYE4_9STRE|nr:MULTISPECIES: hypothetical protein [Streptococcus]KXT78079.1 hypothetical protein STRDD11_02475 [Streptococcus sp. DD11]MBP2621598.1 hypothetical protein [Streptococcus panodentis]
MKKTAVLSILLLSVPALVSCSSVSNKKNASNQSSASSSVLQTSAKQESSASDSKSEETQLVGSDEYGYVKVPKSWVPFHEIEGGNDVQYSDGTDINIVTLNLFKPENLGVTEEEYSSLDTVQVSNSILVSREQSPELSKVWGSKSTIGGYEAYVVNAVSKSGKYLVTWIFKSDDGKFRYVALEGEADTLKILLPMVEESWTARR